MIEERIFKAFDEGKTCVFHNENVARAYIIDYVRKGTKKVALSDRAMSWDTFKNNFLPSHEGMEEVTPLMRQLFCANFLKTQKLSYFINKDKYPESVDRFSFYIASILPSLDRVEKSDVFQSKENLLSPEMKDDIEILFHGYQDFLQSHHLFEPLFELPSVSYAPKEMLERNYVIFCGDTKVGCYDFLDKLPQLQSKIERVGALSIPLDITREDIQLETFQNPVAEQRTTLRRIAYLLDHGVAPRDIHVTLVSFPDDIEDFAKEAEKLDIPLQYQWGRIPTLYPAGRFLKRIQELYEEEFSLSSMKSFLLDPAFPIQEREMAQALIAKGVEYNIPHGALQKEGDFWMKKLSRKKDAPLREWYLTLKKEISGINKSTTVVAMQRSLIRFQTEIFGDRLGWKGTEGEAVYGYCLEKLNLLSSSLKKCGFTSFPGLYAQYIKQLEMENYVPKSEQVGIEVLSYPLSASLSVDHHFVLGLNNSATEVIDKPLDLLPPSIEDVKMRGEIDLTPAILSDYCLNQGKNYFSFSEELYSGAQMPATFFVEKGLKCGRRNASVPEIPDPYLNEKRLWGNEKIDEGCVSSTFQYQALSQAKNSVITSRKGPDITRTLCPSLFTDYIDKLRAEDGFIKISATSIDRFYTCPFAWAMKYLLQVEKEDFEIVYIDNFAVGSLLHSVMEVFFKTVEKKERAFDSVHMDEYRSLISTIFDEQFDLLCKTPQGPMPTAKKFLYQTYKEKLFDILEEEKKYFDQLPGEEEVTLDCTLSDLQCHLNGKFDRIIRLEGERYALIDYKKGTPPITSEKTFMSSLAEKDLSSYQFPLYRRLIDVAQGKKAMRAAYFSIKDGKFHFLWNVDEATEEMQKQTLDQIDTLLDEKIKNMVKSIHTGDFQTTKNPQHCINCDYRRVCRLRYNG